jgi:hypothetical protein
LADHSPDVLAARFFAGSGGYEALRLARRLYADSTAPANAQARLQDFVRANLEDEAARVVARSAWVIASSSQRAVAKLGDDAARLLFDAEGLQMASSALTAAYHTRLLRASGAKVLVDMTAGIGIDAIAFARAGLSVTAYETDPVRAIYLAANIRELGISDRVTVVQQDSCEATFAPETFLYLDPPRRAGTRRWGGEEVAMDMIGRAIQQSPAGILVKLSPAIDPQMLGDFDASIEFVSAGGECKEALLRLGALMTSDARAAVLLPGGERLTADTPIPEPAAGSGVEAPTFYEPDPAVIRAGLTGTLAEHLGAKSVDPDIAYLNGPRLVATPFATAYPILASMPYHRKPLQSWLDSYGAGQLRVQKRGVPDDPKAVRRQFKLRGTRTVILALAKQGRSIRAFLLAPPTDETQIPPAIPPPDAG